MSFKTKALGLAAATALSLSIVTGAMADGSTTVKLNNGTCSASVSSSVDFGSYNWNGANYIFDNTSTPQKAVSVTVNDGLYGGVNCKTTVAAGDLAPQNITGPSILGTKVSFSDGSTTGPFVSSTNLSLTASIDLSAVTNVAPDTYGGNITVSSQAAS